MNRVKQTLSRNELALGGWVTIGHPRVAEVMAQAGFQWLALDAEHGANTIETAERFVQAIQGIDCVPFIRIPDNDSVWMARALDAGFKGIIVPMVNSKADAEKVVAACKYPPMGRRGIGFCRANQYGFNFDNYVAQANDDTIIICQIEHIDGVNGIDEIAAVEGVDGLFIGPYDLSGSMDILGQLDHPKLETAVEKVLQAARTAGIAAGIHVVPPAPEQVTKRCQQGFRFIALSLDITVLGHCFRSMLDKLKDITPSP